MLTNSKDNMKEDTRKIYIVDDAKTTHNIYVDQYGRIIVYNGMELSLDGHCLHIYGTTEPTFKFGSIIIPVKEFLEEYSFLKNQIPVKSICKKVTGQKHGRLQEESLNYYINTDGSAYAKSNYFVNLEPAPSKFHYAEATIYYRGARFNVKPLEEPTRRLDILNDLAQFLNTPPPNV